MPLLLFIGGFIQKSQRKVLKFCAMDIFFQSRKVDRHNHQKRGLAKDKIG